VAQALIEVGAWPMIRLGRGNESDRHINYLVTGYLLYSSYR